MPGFPIRTSSDQRSIDNSPRLNAALHVLHRPSMPRHPPCALNNEHTTNTTTTTNMAIKLCWREHTKHKRTKKSHKPHNLPPQGDKHAVKCSRPLYSSHTTPHTRQQPHHEESSYRNLHGLQPGNNAPDTQQCTKHSSIRS